MEQKKTGIFYRIVIVLISILLLVITLPLVVILETVKELRFIIELVDGLTFMQAEEEITTKNIENLLKKREKIRKFL